MRIDVQGTYGIAVQIYCRPGGLGMMVWAENWIAPYRSARVYLGWIG